MAHVGRGIGSFVAFCFVLCVLEASAALKIPRWQGVWTSYTGALPYNQLADNPLIGNGRVGVMLDAHAPSALHEVQEDGIHNDVHLAGAGAGQPNSLDIWINTNTMWSCGTCGVTVGTKPCYSKDLCTTVGFGGISISLLPSFPASVPLQWNATQAIGTPNLQSCFTSPKGSTFCSMLYLHPSDGNIVVNASWSPAAGDPADVSVQIRAWVLGNVSMVSGLPNPTQATCLNASSGSPLPCASFNGNFSTTSPATLLVSRDATSDVNVISYVRASMAVSLVSAAGLPIPAVFAVTQQSTAVWEVAATLTLTAATPISIVIAHAETTAYNASPTAASAAIKAVSGLSTSPTALYQLWQQSNAWWADFWSQSSVSFPTDPLLEQYWYGAQYVLGCAASTDATVVSPGLYGPWVSVDDPGWHGDYTLDYNVEAFFYGAFSSNHAAQTATYYPIFQQWMPSAALQAVDEAAAAHVSCPPTALHFACHLAPWGMQSLDQTIYMHWNGPFAALLFLNHWEYTRNTTFAAEVTYPLLAGLNEWWACFLNKSSIGPGPDDYVYVDWNAYNPDAEHEGQPVPNPQIGLAFIKREMAAQIDISDALNLPPPAFAQDILSHLVPFNEQSAQLVNPGTVTYDVENGTRCTDDSGEMAFGSTKENCEIACTLDSSCDKYTFCPDPSVAGCTYGPTCWKFNASAPCESAANWTTGIKISNKTINSVVWGACSEPAWCSQDWLCLYPVWPTEYAGGVENETQLAITRSSLVSYTTFATGRPVQLFPAASLAGEASSPDEVAWTRDQVMGGLHEYLGGFFGRNLLPKAPGGGIENVGITRAINDMLATTLPSGAIQLFRMWPLGANASFQGLLVKGGFSVSALFSPAAGVGSPVSITAQYTLGGTSGGYSPSSLCLLVDPWQSNCSSSLAVTCGKKETSFSCENGIISFTAPAAVECLVSNAATAT